MKKKLLIALAITALAFFTFSSFNEVSAQDGECVAYCGDPPDGIGGGGGESGGSSDDDWWQYIGDDADGDGRDDINDNCPWIPNPEQVEADGDGVGDLCDNCPSVANADQADSNNDGEGDACSNDDDGDGVVDGEDNCPVVANSTQLDSDGNGTGNACDGFCIDNPEDDDCGDNDPDEDEIPAKFDLCPGTTSTNNDDYDGDGIGDVCDNDLDGDGVANSIDNCELPNPDQLDMDRDRIGDECDDVECFVVQRDENGVLDPTAPCLDVDDAFTAFIVSYPAKPTEDDELSLTIAANRADLRIQVSFFVEGYPGSSVPVFAPSNIAVVQESDYYTYHINQSPISVIPYLTEGTYTIKMVAELLDGDPQEFTKLTASDTVTIEVAAGSGGGCSLKAKSKPSLALILPLLALLGVVFVRRKRK